MSPGSSSPAQRLATEITHDVDRAVACGGSSMAARERRAEHRNRGSSSVRVARLCFYVDAALAINAELKEFFSMLSRKESLRRQ